MEARSVEEHSGPTSEAPTWREVVEPGGRWSRRLATGDRLRIVDLEG